MSTYQDKDGQWWAQIERGYNTSGGRKYARRRATGEREAKRIERRLLREKDGGTLTDSREPSVKMWAEQWLTHQTTRVRPKTFGGYSTAIRRYVIPTIGHHKLSQLTPAHIRKVADAVRADGSTSTTVRDHQTRLQKCLKDALKDGHKIPAAVLAVDLPKRAATDRTSIPTEQVAAVLAVIAKRDDRSRWMAALLHGMRQGEALGLTWDSVDLDRGLLDISWQLQPIPYLHGCGGSCRHKSAGTCPDRTFRVPDGFEMRRLEGQHSLVRPKTSAGKRLIPLVPWMHTAMQDWQALDRLSPHGLVWPAADGSPQTSRDDHSEWVAIQKLAGIEHKNGRPWAGHEARHTAATSLLEAGVDPHTVTALLGHSSIATSRGYQHVDQALARSAMEAVARQMQLGSS